MLDHIVLFPYKYKLLYQNLYLQLNQMLQMVPQMLLQEVEESEWEQKITLQYNRQWWLNMINPVKQNITIKMVLK